MAYITNNHYVSYNGAGYKANTTHFPSFGGTNIIALTQWQYWWWFWFTFLLCLYFVITLRILQTRTLSLHPKIATTLRSRGRWGDLIICAVPVFWCANILSNSHFLLRHLEWQTENSLFTLRVRGKQWYWVYKFDLRAYYDINKAQIIIGKNRKVKETSLDVQKWSLLSDGVNYPYIKRDRATDPFDKFNRTQSRRENNALYNAWVSQTLSECESAVELFYDQTLLEAMRNHATVWDRQNALTLTTSKYRPDWLPNKHKYFAHDFLPLYYKPLYTKILKKDESVNITSLRSDALAQLIATGQKAHELDGWKLVAAAENSYGGYSALASHFNWLYHVESQEATNDQFNKYVNPVDIANARRLNNHLLDSIKVWKHNKIKQINSGQVQEPDLSLIRYLHNGLASYLAIDIVSLNHQAVKFTNIKNMGWYTPAQFELAEYQPLSAYQQALPCQPCLLPTKFAKVTTTVMKTLLKGTTQARHEILINNVTPVLNQMLAKDILYAVDAHGNQISRFIANASSFNLRTQKIQQSTGPTLMRLIRRGEALNRSYRLLAVIAKFYHTPGLQRFTHRSLKRTTVTTYTAWNAHLKAFLLAKNYRNRNRPHCDRLINLTARHFIIPYSKMWQKNDWRHIPDYLAVLNNIRLSARTLVLLTKATRELQLEKAYYGVLERLILSRTKQGGKLDLFKIVNSSKQLSERCDLRKVGVAARDLYTRLWALAVTSRKSLAPNLLMEMAAREKMRRDEIVVDIIKPKTTHYFYDHHEGAFSKLTQKLAVIHHRVRKPKTIKYIAKATLNISPAAVKAVRADRRFYITEQIYLDDAMSIALQKKLIKNDLTFIILDRPVQRLFFSNLRTLSRMVKNYLLTYKRPVPVSNKGLLSINKLLESRIPLDLKKSNTGILSLLAKHIYSVHQRATQAKTLFYNKHTLLLKLQQSLMNRLALNRRLDIISKLPKGDFTLIQLNSLNKKNLSGWALFNIKDIMTYELGTTELRRLCTEAIPQLQKKAQSMLRAHLVKNYHRYYWPSQSQHSTHRRNGANFVLFLLEKEPTFNNTVAPITKHRWLKNNFNSQNLLTLHKVPRTPGQPLLKLNFNSSVTQLRDLNSNVHITFIQKKAEPINFTKAIDKKNNQLNKWNLARTTATVTRETQSARVGKVILRKNMLNNATTKKKAAYRREIYHNKRLLWVTKQIVLPIKTPITIITNSYDVIHSWFIPGLGLKMDCVPGRSTHHTIFIDRPGYYYGQCAEVCGRRHHHMPIKILAVPFIHFIYWWNHKVRAKAVEALNTKH